MRLAPRTARTSAEYRPPGGGCGCRSQGRWCAGAPPAGPDGGSGEQAAQPLPQAPQYATRGPRLVAAAVALGDGPGTPHEQPDGGREGRREEVVHESADARRRGHANGHLEHVATEFGDAGQLGRAAGEDQPGGQDGDVVGDVVPAQRQHRRVERRAVEEEGEVGRAGADVSYGDAQVAFRVREDRLRRCQGRGHPLPMMVSAPSRVPSPMSATTLLVPTSMATRTASLSTSWLSLLDLASIGSGAG